MFGRRAGGGCRASVDVDAAVWDRVRQAHEKAHAASVTRPVYGRTTGVGANRDAIVAAGDASTHDLRLLLSHAAGVGDQLDARTTRAAMLIRLNQLAGPATTGGTWPCLHGRRPTRVSAISASAVRSPVPIVPVMCTAGERPGPQRALERLREPRVDAAAAGGELVEADQHRRPGGAGVELIADSGRVAQQEPQVVGARVAGRDDRVAVGADPGRPPVDRARTLAARAFS